RTLRRDAGGCDRPRPRSRRRETRACRGERRCRARRASSRRSAGGRGGGWRSLSLSTSSANAQASYHAVPRPLRCRSTLGGMPVILVLEDDSATRNALVATLRELYPQAPPPSARTQRAPGLV